MKRNDAIATADLSDELRRWLATQHLPPQIKAAALTYVTAAMVAKDAESLSVAYALVDSWAATMKDQIANFGVGADHP